MSELNDRIETFCKKVNDMLELSFKDNMCKAVVEVEYISDKWARLTKFDIWNDVKSKGGSVYAFICLKDYQTKTLGVLKTGDIHTPASWKAPAKHARANVFQDNCISCASPYGLTYLRGYN